MSRLGFGSLTHIVRQTPFPSRASTEGTLGVGSSVSVGVASLPLHRRLSGVGAACLSQGYHGDPRTKRRPILDRGVDTTRRTLTAPQTRWVPGAFRCMCDGPQTPRSSGESLFVRQTFYVETSKSRPFSASPTSPSGLARGLRVQPFHPYRSSPLPGTLRLTTPGLSG